MLTLHHLLPHNVPSAPSPHTMSTSKASKSPPSRSGSKPLGSPGPLLTDTLAFLVTPYFDLRGRSSRGRGGRDKLESQNGALRRSASFPRHRDTSTFVDASTHSSTCSLVLIATSSQFQPRTLTAGMLPISCSPPFLYPSCRHTRCM